MPLRPLNCTRCGAPLKELPQDDLIRCGYCGQIHHFDPNATAQPPLQAPAPVALPASYRRLWMLPVGMSVLGLLTTVGFMLASPPPSSSPPAAGGGTSAITPSSDGPGDPGATYRAGEAVQVWWGSRWWDGTVKGVNDGGSYHIGYDGWSATWDEDVTARRLRRRDAQ